LAGSFLQEASLLLLPFGSHVSFGSVQHLLKPLSRPAAARVASETSALSYSLSRPGGLHGSFQPAAAAKLPQPAAFLDPRVGELREP